MNEEMNYDEMSILEKYEHIRKKLKTDNKEILLASRKFIEERLETEEKRRNLAENRATAMLGIIGVFAGLIFRFRRSIQGTGDLNYFLLIFYLASIAFLLKAGYYGIRVLWPDKVNRLNSTLVYDMTEEDELFLSLKKEIAWKIWEYKEQINPNSQKLFFLHRCQRNTLTSIFMFIIFSIAVLMETYLSFSEIRIGFIILVAIIISVWLAMGDKIIDKFFNFWELG